jgi:hypothetical protein
LTTKVLVTKKVFLKTGRELTLETVETNWWLKFQGSLSTGF